MRAEVTAEKLRRFIEALGNAAQGPGRVYLTGAATALLEGWRAMSVDLDLKMDPEPPGAFEAIARLKDELDISVELAAPDQFVPPLPGWQERSRFIATHGPVSFYEYDPYGQVLAKIARDHDRDRLDVREYLARGLVDPDRFRALYAQVVPQLIRYPRIDQAALEKRIDRALA
jgi:uncharacterized nucleotidyltransferase DUF6036